MTKRLAIVTRTVAPNDGQGRVNLEIAKEAVAQGRELVLIAEDVAPEIGAQAASVHLFPPPRVLPGRLLRDQAFALRSAGAVAAERARGAAILSNGFASWAGSDVNAVHFVHSAWLQTAQQPWAAQSGARGLHAAAYSGLNARLERAAFAKTSGKVVAVSEKVRTELVTLCGLTPDKVAVVLNGVDTDEFRPAASGGQAAARDVFGLPQGALIALFAGDLRTPRKNLDTAMAALARVPGLHLAVAGRHEGTAWPEIAQQLNIAHRVHFLGFQRAMPELMRAADLFVFPSRYEPCGLVLLEALASGLPVITARSAGGAEIVGAESGLVLPDCEDAGALAAAMESLAADPARRTGMAHAARVVALAHRWPAMARQYLALLDQARTGIVISNPARPRKETADA